jgi:hypothetical protein
MASQVEAHVWSVDSLFTKSQLYALRMTSAESGSGEQALWSAALLEFLARAALANISPVLLADEKNWRNISFALGKNATAKRFNPSSIGIKEVLARLSEFDARVTQEVINFCASHFDKRNSELHSGEFAFVNYGSSSWLPKFFHACEVFLICMDRQLTDLFSEVEHIRSLIDSLSDQTAQSVSADIVAYKKVWSDKSCQDKETLTQRASLWASRHVGHRVRCPACTCEALVFGTPTGQVTTLADEDGIEQKNKGNFPLTSNVLHADFALQAIRNSRPVTSVTCSLQLLVLNLPIFTGYLRSSISNLLSKRRSAI